MQISDLNLNNLFTATAEELQAENVALIQKQVATQTKRQLALAKAKKATLKANYDADLADMTTSQEVQHAKLVANAKKAFRNSISVDATDFSFQTLMNAVKGIDTANSDAAAKEAQKQLKERYDAAVADVDKLVADVTAVQTAFKPA